MMIESAPAPEWNIAQWLNTSVPLSVDALRGKVILALAFQMLCPGCVSQGLPQALRARAAFGPNDLAVIGLHTVFEHHAAMTPLALEAFLHEYRIGFPVGVDEPDGSGGPPLTMRAYEMRGTPTTLLIDREGRLRMHTFGYLSDLQLGAELSALIGERPIATARGELGGVCTPKGCS